MNIEEARINMLTQQIRAWGVLDQAVLDLIATTPREQFVPSAYRHLAFADMCIPIGLDQVMLTPKEEAYILQALQIKPTDNVLEVGTGTGYFTALLAKQAGHVESIDLFAEFTLHARQQLTTAGIANVTLTTADAAAGWARQAPYDIIVITGSAPILPSKFRESLASGGRLFAIVGQKPIMEAIVWTRINQTEWTEKKLFETIVPPLINALQPLLFTL